MMNSLIFELNNKISNWEYDFNDIREYWNSFKNFLRVAKYSNNYLMETCIFAKWPSMKFSSLSMRINK